MTRPSASQFRQKLVLELASTRWPRRIALYGVEDEHLASKLGVRKDVLNDAINLVRSGFRSPEQQNEGAEPSKLVQLRMHYPVEVMTLVANLATEMNTATTNLVRDLLHAAMQTSHEPSHQPRLRQRKAVLRGKLLSGVVTHEYMLLSPALKECVQYRAIAYGETPHGYVRAWLVDLVEGRLGHIDIQSIRLSQMFDSIEAYVIPVLPDLPVVEGEP